MLRLHFANRFERLAGLLVEQLGPRDRSPFEPDEVVVPSAALRRQLTLQLAQRHGVCAQLRFSWLGQWLWQQMSRLLPDVPTQSPLATPLLTWRLLAAFGDQGLVGAHPRLAGYLAEADPLMRFELAQRVAALFDQYLTYRPEWLAAWRDGGVVGFTADDGAAREDEAWQAALWRHVLGELGGELGASGQPPAPAFVQLLRDEAGAASKLPRSVHVFVLPTMPPAHLDLLQQIARHVEVQVYALNPCREYWFDVVDHRRLAYLEARGQAAHQEVGHRLLAGWGRQTRSHLGLLVDAAGDAASEGAIDEAYFDEPDGPSLLARLQASILDLQEPAAGSVRLPDDDRSLEIHACHSLTRELEVLHDRLLGLFADHPGLQPSDVLVATPDLEAAAALIDAVFGSTPEPRRIPYVITGLARSSVNSAARAMLELLGLVASRCPVSRVFAWLRQPLVARRFGLDDDDLQRVQVWLQEAGVHWALDAAQRQTLDLPASAHYSFQEGLERLLLGYSLPSSTALPFLDRLPAGTVEGSDAQALGGLWTFVQALVSLRATWTLPQAASRWPALLTAATLEFMQADADSLDDLQELLQAVEALGGQFEDSRFDEPLNLEVVQAALQRQLDDPPHGGVPTGSVSFSSMNSLRNLPFAVVCVIGLDDGRFPSTDRPAEFDLMACRARDSDRQRRHDERNLFLDLLLAARHTLHLSYRGRDVRDNAVLPPSVLISELLDLCVPAIADDPLDPAALRRAHARLVVEHPLQPFAEVAFRPDADPRLRSFNAELAQALRQPGPSRPLAVAGAGFDEGDEGDDEGDPDDVDDVLGGDFPDPDRHDDRDARADAARPFFSAPLAAPGPEWRRLTLERLIEFFRLPCRFLLRHRLGIELRRTDDELSDDEPFVPGLPQRRALAQRVLPLLLAGHDLDSVQVLARAGPDYPAGALGDVQLAQELPRLAEFADTWRRLATEAVLPPLSASLELDVAGEAWQLDLSFAELRPSGLLRQRYDERRAGDLVGAWLQHLALCALAPQGVEPRTTLLTRDGCVQFRTCSAPEVQLAALLRLVRIGLMQPLYFFPKSAWALLAEGENLARARTAWSATPRHPHAESADPACRLALRGWADPLGAGVQEFVDCAKAVFGPLLQHLEPVVPEGSAT